MAGPQALPTPIRSTAPTADRTGPTPSGPSPSAAVTRSSTAAPAATPSPSSSSKSLDPSVIDTKPNPIPGTPGKKALNYTPMRTPPEAAAKPLRRS